MAIILLIEDDAALQEAYGYVLRSIEHEVVAAYNGKEGLEATKRQAFDYIILDINMPIMNGLEFLRRFQKRKPPTTTIIVFSNYVDQDVESEALAHGAAKVVLKSSMTPSRFLSILQ